jgi:hypothetical protein
VEIELVIFVEKLIEIFSYQRSVPIFTLRFNGKNFDTLNDTFGKVAEIACVCEFCDTAIFIESEKGVPAQFFEYAIDELVCVESISLSVVAE